MKTLKFLSLLFVTFLLFSCEEVAVEEANSSDPAKAVVSIKSDEIKIESVENISLNEVKVGLSTLLESTGDNPITFTLTNGGEKIAEGIIDDPKALMQVSLTENGSFDICLNAVLDDEAKTEVIRCGVITVENLDNSDEEGDEEGDDEGDDESDDDEGDDDDDDEEGDDESDDDDKTPTDGTLIDGTSMEE